VATVLALRAVQLFRIMPEIVLAGVIGPAGGIVSMPGERAGGQAAGWGA
jgi:hypothetical protein